MEEIANSITHGVGALLAVAGLVVLVVLAARRGDPWRVTAFSIYGATLVALYLASTFYHAFPQPRLKRFFHILDHASIFLLIAGSYTPPLLVAMRGGWGWALFGVVWGIAAAGVVMKLFWTGRFRVLSTLLYVAMGWLIVIAWRPLLRSVPAGLIPWLVGGGLAYTLGVVFYGWKRLPFHHAVWHLFVLAGSIAHYLGYLFYLS